MKTDVSKDGAEIITPLPALLDTPIGVENLTCTVKGCGRVVSNTSALRLHLLKSHRIGEPLENSNKKKKLFACPVKGCPRNVESEQKKFFKCMYLLKRHYLLVHAEKKHACEKCGKKFGTALSTNKHAETCRKFFYCSCGVHYTTKNSLRTHLQNRDDTHKEVPDPAEEEEVKDKQQTLSQKSEARQTVTVPCFLYIPKSNAQPIRNKTEDLIVQNSPQPQWNDRFIRILPKKKKTTEPVTEPIHFLNPTELIKYCNLLNTDETKQKGPEPPNIATTKSNLYEKAVEGSQKENENQKRKQKNTLSKFEKRMNFLQSSEAQQILSNPGLLACTIRHHEEIRKKCPTVKSGNCRHFHIKSEKQISTTQNLISNFTQTPNPIFPNGQQVDTGIQTCGLNYDYGTVEVLETSDFSTQCQLMTQQSDMETEDETQTMAADNETQTEQMDNWLAQLQTNTNLTDMETQTNLATPQNDHTNYLDKSVQLDDILSGKTWDTGSSIYISGATNGDSQNVPSLFMSNSGLDYKQTISTQTLDSDEVQFEISNSSKIKDIVLPSDNTNTDEPLSMSFGTQTGLDDNDLPTNHETLSFGTQTVFENNFFSSSSTQTWDAEETSINAKNIETQTAISFSDLLDSSFIDEYLNTDRITSTETQTYQNDYEASKEVVTIETQTY